MRFDKSARGNGLEVYSRLEEGKAQIWFTAYLDENGEGNRGTEDKGTKSRGTEDRGMENKGTADREIEDREMENRGMENRGTEDRGTESRGTEDKGIENRGTEAGKGLQVEFQMLDREGQPVITICREAQKECRARGQLCYPHVWQSVEEPYLYQVQASLIRDGRVIDRIVENHAVCRWKYLPLKGCQLNHKPFSLHTVVWDEDFEEGEGWWQEGAVLLLWKKRLEAVLEAGGNMVCFATEKIPALLCKLCQKLGLAVGVKEGDAVRIAAPGIPMENGNWKKDGQEGGDLLLSEQEYGRLPRIAGEGEWCLLTVDGQRKRECFYYYKALWSKTPFVYLCGCDKFRHREGKVTVRVYSNQEKVVLYVEGAVFEYRSGGPDFVFEEVPLSGEETVIAVQAAGCYASTTLLRE